MIGLIEFAVTVGAVVLFALFGVLPLWREKWRQDRERREPRGE